ncbi:Tse2 family ADP-ribosyltransferase toxin [Microbulbifer sp. SSSA002]|uniref:Tse2 family ADP-ribosyltransferase toxin n=1 Tax=Microbulbifer sp. SSSA002 TaxID=3243376 RepID=UPI00403966A3
MCSTEIPGGILIIEDDYNDRFQATHYSIVPDHPMSIANFKVLIDQLLANIEKQRGQLKNA